jgi:hypothetical protein
MESCPQNKIKFTVVEPRSSFYLAPESGTAKKEKDLVHNKVLIIS